MGLVLVTGRLAQLAVAVAVAVIAAACIPGPTSTPSLSDLPAEPADVVAVALEMPGGVEAIGSTPWGTLVGGNSQTRAWLTLSSDGRSWSEVGSEVTSTLGRDAVITSIASHDSVTVVLVGVGEPENQRLAVLRSDDGRTWRLTRPAAMEIGRLTVPVGLVRTAQGFTAIAWARRGGEAGRTDVLVFTSADGLDWVRRSAPTLTVTELTPVAIAASGGEIDVLLQGIGGMEGQGDASILVGKHDGSEWSATVSEELRNNHRNTIAADGETIIVAGCTSAIPTHGAIWRAPDGPAGPFTLDDLGPRTCIDALAIDGDRVFAAGTDGDAGAVWIFDPLAGRIRVSLPAVMPGQGNALIETLAIQQGAVIVGGSVGPGLAGSGPRAPGLWVVKPPTQ